MERSDNEMHIETDEARGGSTPHIVRWVLATSLVLAIIAMSLVWIIPALGNDDASRQDSGATTAQISTPNEEA